VTWWSDIPAVLNGATQGAVVWADCREFLPFLPDACIDAIVTDPPYGLKFMGRAWDHGVPGEPFWRDFLRVAKPGCHLLAFGGTRTHHRLWCAVEDAGWEIRDSLMWLHGQGFPKAVKTRTTLKPGWEPILLARKRLDGKVEQNVRKHGTGRLNIDGCRIGVTVESWPASRSYAPGQMQPGGRGATEATGEAPPGRWPANVVLSHHPECVSLGTKRIKGHKPADNANHRNRPSGFGMTGGKVGAYNDADGKETVESWQCHPDCPVGMLDEQSGACRPSGNVTGAEPSRAGYSGGWGRVPFASYGDSGGASRFFYVAKASSSERSGNGQVDNRHPTVKPLDLMQWLVRLVCPPGGIVLDPFCGSGSTLIAAEREGVRYLGIDNDEASTRTAHERLAAETPLFERKADAARASQRSAASQSSNERG